MTKFEGPDPGEALSPGEETLTDTEYAFLAGIMLDADDNAVAMGISDPEAEERWRQQADPEFIAIWDKAGQESKEQVLETMKKLIIANRPKSS